MMNNSSSSNFFKTQKDRGEKDEENIFLYKDDPLYKHINMIFFKLFDENKIASDQKFDKNVWFLKHNKEFQDIINNKRTQDGENYLGFFKLLQGWSINGKNFRNLNIDVRKFVNEISKQICEATNRRNNADDMIKHFKMDEMKEIIIDKFCKEKSNLDSFSGTTELKFSIRQIENFPEGNYSIKIICDSFDDDGINKIISYKEISAGILNKRNIFINGYGNINTPEYFETIYIKNENNYEYLNLSDCDLSKSKFNEEASYIGLLINSFKFVIENNIGDSFAISENETMIDTFINNLDVLLKDKTFKISSSVNASIDKKNKNLVKAGMDRNFIIFYEMEINFNKKVKVLVLEKIFNIFQDTLNAKYDNEKLINSILDNFPEIKDEINVLTREKKIEQKEKCCCLIF
jgi:hypothetical protein